MTPLMTTRLATATMCLMSLFGLSACGGGGGGASSQSAAPTYKVGGTVSGLSGSGLVLRNNNVDLSITANGAFTLAASFSSGATYAVTVATQPSAPGQVCSVTSGTGTIGSGDVTNISVICVTPPMTLLSSNPANNATAVDRSIAPELIFSAPINASTVNGNVILKQANQTVPATVSTAGSTVTLTPAIKLSPLTTYTLSVGAGLQGSNSELLSAAVNVSFTTRDRQWQTAELIETNNGHASDPQVAIDAAGNAIAVWHQWDGVHYSIFAARYVAKSGSTSAGWGPAVLIENDNASDAAYPQIAVDSAGNAIAVWEQADGTRYSIWANRYVVGSGWLTPTPLENTNDEAIRPKIAIDAAGNALVVWFQTDGMLNNAWANRYVSGSGWGTATLIETDNAGSVFFPQIASDAAGNGISVWTQWDGARYNIWANRYVAGSGWSIATIVETDVIGGSGAAYEPRVAIDDAGNAHAVWFRWDGAHVNIRTKRYTANNGWGGGTLLSDNKNDAWDPQISADAAGNAFAIWSQFDGVHYNIWANRYLVDSGWGSAVLIQTGDGNAFDPQIAFDAAGNAIAVWEQSDGTLFNIWASRNPTGNGWGTPTLIETNDSGSAGASQIAVNASGDAFAVWQQYEGTPSSIRANRFD